jgi:hypothetical protein
MELLRVLSRRELGGGAVPEGAVELLFVFTFGERGLFAS